MYYVPFIYWEGERVTRTRMYLSYTEVERVTRTRMYYIPFIYWDWEGDKKKNVLCPFHLLRERGWQEEECSMYLSYTEIERVTRRRMYYLPFIYWGREGDKKKNVLCTFHLLRVRGWQEQECIMYLSYTEGERVTRTTMYYVPFIYWGWQGDKNKNVLCTFHIRRVRGLQEEECIMCLSYTEGERVTRRRMYYLPFIYWGREGDKKKNVVCTFHILRVRGLQEEECIMCLSYTEGERVRGWQEQECIMYLSYTEVERATRRRMYYVPFIYWGWEGDKNKNVLCIFHILRVRGWQEQECIMYLFTEGRVTRTRMYYVPFIYWGWEGYKKKNVLCAFHILRREGDKKKNVLCTLSPFILRVRGWQEQECIMYLSYTEGERVTRTRMYYVPFIYWGWEGDKNKNVLCTFHILRVRGWQEEECIMCLSYTEGERVTRRMYYVPFIYRGWEGDKKKNVLCTFHLLRVRGWQEQECSMYLSYTEIERVTRRRMYYLPFIYWGREGDKKKNVLCTFHLLRVRGWQEQECSIYLSYTEIERVTRRRMYYLPFIYWGREGDKKKNVLCTFHLLRERGWQEEECSMYLSYTEIERVTRRRMYYLPFIYWGREGDKKKNVLCTFHLLRVRGWQEQECIMYLSYTEGERVTRTRMYYVPFIYWGWGWEGWQEQEEECIMSLSYTEGERVTRRRMYYVPFIYWGWEGYKKKNVLCAFHILRGWQEEECIMYLSFTEGERVTRTRMYYVPFIYWGWEGDKNNNVLCTFHILRVTGWQEEECIMYLSYTEGERVTRTRM